MEDQRRFMIYCTGVGDMQVTVSDIEEALEVGAAWAAEGDWGQDLPHRELFYVHYSVYEIDERGNETGEHAEGKVAVLGCV